MSLIFDTCKSGAGTHAIIIGVGEYPHLLNGMGKLYSGHSNMSQLTSPAFSALAFADWILSDFHNPKAPLASVELLISDNASHTFSMKDGSTVSIERATMSGVKKAIREWKKRGQLCEESLMIFFFCGHGMTAGTEISLLLEDFGGDEDGPFDGAIDLRQFHLGMQGCTARQQVYFVDACRTAPSTILKSSTDNGDGIISASASSLRGKRPVQQPIFYSTLSGQAAYGRGNAPSLFTEALLKALKGAADNIEADEKWRVDTYILSACINELLIRTAEIEGLDDPQINSVDNCSRIFLHELTKDPAVPVVVGCQPRVANAKASMSCFDCLDPSNHKSRTGFSGHGWDLELNPGKYMFMAAFPDELHESCSKERHIHPPFRRVLLEVEK